MGPEGQIPLYLARGLQGWFLNLKDSHGNHIQNLDDFWGVAQLVAVSVCVRSQVHSVVGRGWSQVSL